MTDAFVDSTFNADPPQLQQDCAGWRMNEIAA
jgi:hypothetical protein